MSLYSNLTETSLSYNNMKLNSILYVFSFTIKTLVKFTDCTIQKTINRLLQQISQSLSYLIYRGRYILRNKLSPTRSYCLNLKIILHISKVFIYIYDLVRITAAPSAEVICESKSSEATYQCL